MMAFDNLKRLCPHKLFVVTALCNEPPGGLKCKESHVHFGDDKTKCLLFARKTKVKNAEMACDNWQF